MSIPSKHHGVYLDNVGGMNKCDPLCDHIHIGCTCGWRSGVCPEGKAEDSLDKVFGLMKKHLLENVE